MTTGERIMDGDSGIGEELSEIRMGLARLVHKIIGRTFLISGGAGFIGSWFCETAIMMGAKVICVDNLLASSEHNVSHLIGHRRFQFVTADIAQFELAESIDYIVHMASIASPPLYQKYPLETLDSGVMGTRHILEYAYNNPVSGIIIASTSEVYGSPPDDCIPTPETYYGNVSSYGPRSMYDESKRAQEAYCYAYFSNGRRNGKEIPIRVARIFNTYGPRLDTSNTSQYGRALIKFVVQALNNETITVYGEGAQTRSFCYITDQIIGLYKLLLTDGINGEVVNIGNSTEVSIAELATMIRESAGSTSQIMKDSPPAYNIENDPQRRSPDLTKAESLLGYKPSVSLEDGLRRTIDWTKEKW